MCNIIVKFEACLGYLCLGNKLNIKQQRRFGIAWQCSNSQNSGIVRLFFEHLQNL